MEKLETQINIQSLPTLPNYVHSIPQAPDTGVKKTWKALAYLTLEEWLSMAVSWVPHDSTRNLGAKYYPMTWKQPVFRIPQFLGLSVPDL
jgi:hypothetical protein